MADSTTQETSCRMIPFHHKKEARRHNKKQWLKLRKREWMMKMYTEGKEGATQNAGVPKEEGTNLEEGVNAQEEDFEDWETEAAMLIDWSDALDFDAYTGDWSKLATSARSELFIGTSGIPVDELDEGASPHDRDFGGSPPPAMLS